MKFRRSIVKRTANSYMTTIPAPALFNLPEPKDYDVVWEMDEKKGSFHITFEPKSEEEKAKTSITII